MDQLYLLLITNKGSNIMEDLDTLRLLSKGTYGLERGCMSLVGASRRVSSKASVLRLHAYHHLSLLQSSLTSAKVK
jgi:hypothetical protein